MARCEIFAPDEVAIAHVSTHVCRWCFWGEEYLQAFAAFFRILLDWTARHTAFGQLAELLRTM